MGRPCKCCNRKCTTRLYDSNGNQRWVYDHGAETICCATSVDDDGNAVYYVAGQRDSDVTIMQSTPATTWILSSGKTVTGGMFRLALDVTGDFGAVSYRTSQLAVSCAAADVQTALSSLANAAGLTFTCSGGTLDVADITIEISGATFTPWLKIQTQEVTGPSTIRKLDANGKLLKSVGTKMPVKDLVVLGGNLYVLTDSSGVYTEPSGDTESGGTVYARIGPAVGEVGGGTLNLVYRGQGILTTPYYLLATANLNWNCTASDVQTALVAIIPDPGVTVSSTGGPLPDVPINFGISGWTLGDPHFLGVLQGTLTGPVSLYKFDSDLNLLATGHTGANTNHVLITDGTSLFVGHSGEGKAMWLGLNNSSATGDVTFRKFDDTLAPQSDVAIRSGASCQAAAVNGGHFCIFGAGKDRTYKLVGSGASFTFTINGSPTSSISGTATAADINTALSGTSLGAQGGPLPTYPVYITESLLSHFPFTAHPTYSTVSVSAGTLTTLVSETDGGPLRLYDSSGAYITTDGVQLGVSNEFAPGWHGINVAPSGNWAVNDAPDVGTAVEVRQYKSDLSAEEWSVAIPDPSTAGDAVVDSVGFDSTNQMRVSGNAPTGGDGKSTRAYDDASPPNPTWSKQHGTGPHSDDGGPWNPDAGLLNEFNGSIYDQAIDSSDNILVTGTRVSRGKFQ